MNVHSWVGWRRGVPLLLLAGCSLFFPVRQDPGTIQGLNDLKPAIRTLYDSFRKPAVDPAQVAQMRDRLDALQAREMAKGDANALMRNQVARCRDMFDAHVRTRNEGKAWSTAHHDNQLENMLDAIDLALRTEMSKTP